MHIRHERNKSHNKQYVVRTNIAFDYSTLCLCCTAVLLFKAIGERCRMFCSYYCRCLRTPRIPSRIWPCPLYHVIIYVPTQIGNICNFGISCIIPVRVPLNCIHIYVSSSRVKRTIPSFFGLALLMPFLLACPFPFLYD